MAENETLWNWGNHQKYHADLENYIGTKILENSTIVDDVLSENSQNAIQNKAVATALKNVNADMLDGLHADDFVKSGEEQINIPSDVDVPTWIRSNAKRHTLYQTVGGTQTNLPNNNPNYIWYVYNGNTIWAYVNDERRLYVCGIVNGIFSGWQATYTSTHKPYDIGTASITASSTDTVHTLEVLNFTPSVVICRQMQNDDLNGKIMWATPCTNGFSIVTDADNTTNVIQYIAFR